MSRADTGARTLDALQGWKAPDASVSRDGVMTRTSGAPRGLRVRTLPVLSDVDTMADARAVAAQVPGGRFAATVAEVAALPAPAPGNRFAAAESAAVAR